MQTRFSHRNRNQTYFKSKPFSTSLLPFSLPWDSAWPHSIHQLRFLGKSSRPGADAVPSDKTLMHLIQQLQGVWPLRIRLSAKLQSSKLNLAIGIHLQTAAVSGCATCEEQIRIRAKKGGLLSTLEGFEGHLLHSNWKRRMSATVRTPRALHKLGP